LDDSSISLLADPEESDDVFSPAVLLERARLFVKCTNLVSQLNAAGVITSGEL
jgi:hypothetical protein